MTSFKNIQEMTVRITCYKCDKRTTHKVVGKLFHCGACDHAHICGEIKRDMMMLGIGPKAARELEVLFWKFYDEISPPTSWERGMMNFVKGRSKKNYIETFAENFHGKHAILG